MRTRIHIEDLSVRCVVGCEAAERERKQVVAVDLEVELDASIAVHEDGIDHTVDYMALERGVRFILESGRFRLLETAGAVLVRYLLAPPTFGSTAPVKAKVSLTKKDLVLGGGRPRVELSSIAHKETYRMERRDWGALEVLMENRWLGLYRLIVAPGRRVPPMLLRQLKGRVQAETAGLVEWGADGPTDVLEPGAHASWDPEVSISWRNLGDGPSSLLCLTRPAIDDIRHLELPQVVD